MKIHTESAVDRCADSAWRPPWVKRPSAPVQAGTFATATSSSMKPRDTSGAG